jgi:hypothetical protein
VRDRQGRAEAAAGREGRAKATVPLASYPTSPVARAPLSSGAESARSIAR